ncbi:MULTISPECIES: AraC family transcriptional regulator [Aliivibrio]|uniref:AraC family transcriptional regulator n=1 Tax=Aliivibrio TaxID=511678 RepID=UPI0003A27650|nr:helix-turn-helix transcriptional regulator [Aliivibrio logei]
MISNQQLPANEMMKNDPLFPALAKVIEMPKGYVDSLHHHTWHQVIFPIKGLLQTQVGSYQYLLPHTSALFVPATLAHESIALTNTTFIGIYINPAYCFKSEEQVRTISLTPFIKELIQEIRRKCLQVESQTALLGLLQVLHDQMMHNDVVTFQLLLPKDRRLKQIFDKLTETPALDWPLKIWGEEVGASERTLSRLFVKEFKTSFPLWRQQLRLIYSLSLLDEEITIQAIADEIGYHNDSSYIKAFKSYFDMTPQQFRGNSNRKYYEL